MFFPKVLFISSHDNMIQPITVGFIYNIFCQLDFLNYTL